MLRMSSRRHEAAPCLTCRATEVTPLPALSPLQKKHPPHLSSRVAASTRDSLRDGRGIISLSAYPQACRRCSQRQAQLA